MGEKKLSFKAIAGIVAACLLILVLVVVGFQSFTTIPEGYVGMKYQLGKIVSVDLEAGLQFKVPFIQDVVLVDMREQVFELTTNAYTKDSQTVESVEVKVNYRLNRAELLSLAQNIGVNNVSDKLIFPQVNTILKNAIGNYRAEDLIQNRQDLQESVETTMREDLSSYGVEVMAVSLVNIDFDDVFEEAVRAKIVAEQDALRAQNKTKEVEEQAKQAVIDAQAEADSKRLIADAEAYSIPVIQEQIANSPHYLELEKIKQWDGKLPQVSGNTVNPFVSLDGSNSSSCSAAQP